MTRRHQQTNLSIIYLAAVALFLVGNLGAESGGEWPQWRGPNRDGVSRETGILKTWPENGPGTASPTSRCSSKRMRFQD